MKVLTAKQLRLADQYTIEHEPIFSIDLMERAAKRFTYIFSNLYDQNRKVKVFCGTGNNGGDGLAISRRLINGNYNVETFVIGKDDKATEDFKSNKERLSHLRDVQEILNEHKLPEIHDSDIVVDAIFGTGLSRPIEGLHAAVIHHLNGQNCTRVAVDIPSGLMTESPVVEGVVFNANRTISFQSPKLAFFLPENHQYVGEWNVADIKLHPDFIAKCSSTNFLVTKDFVRNRFRKRLKYDHKGSYGHGLLVAGKVTKQFASTGAAVLSAKAALKTGIGLLTVHTPRNAYYILQATVPEAMTSIDPNPYVISNIESLDIDNYKAIAIGPGIGRDFKTRKVLKKLIKSLPSNIPLILDADALNILSDSNDLLSVLPKGSILTPHPKEFERLFGSSKNSYERIKKQRNLSLTKAITIVYKGAHSTISTPSGNCYFNNTGNPGMATAGSGDVLTGIILGLCAQSYSPDLAAILGTYLHGLAGDCASRHMAKTSITSSDISSHLSDAFSSINQEL